MHRFLVLALILILGAGGLAMEPLMDSNVEWLLHGPGWVRGFDSLHYTSVSFGDAFAGKLAWGDYTYGLDITPKEYGSQYASIRVFFRLIGTWEGYGLNITTGGMSLVRFDGAWNITRSLGSASVGIKPGETARIEIQTQGNEFKVSKNGQVVLTAKDPENIYPMGYVGLRSDHALFTIENASVHGSEVSDPHLRRLADMGVGREIVLPEGELFPAGTDASGGAREIMLIYTQATGIRWTSADALGYVGYLGTDLSFQDWFFDTFLFLGLTGPGGTAFDSPSRGRPAAKAEWIWWLDRLFSPREGLDAFERAVATGQDRMDDPEYKAKVIVMIPYPMTQIRDFGSVVEGGQSLDFGGRAALDHRKQAVDWFMEEFLGRWETAAFENLEFIGFYWLAENVESQDPPLLQYTGERVRELGYRFFWIPYFKASGYERWKELGFDAVMKQPNYMFNPTINRSRFATTVGDALKYGMGIEIEADETVLVSASGRERYLDYLRAGVEYGYDGPVLRGYYQGVNIFSRMILHSNPEVRYLYDATYQFVKGEFNEKLSK